MRFAFILLAAIVPALALPQICIVRLPYCPSVVYLRLNGLYRKSASASQVPDCTQLSAAYVPTQSLRLAAKMSVTAVRDLPLTNAKHHSIQVE